uniref:Uncharacterized protein n=1 Tax=Triticum urartu TaxID=4572 RepID=A0A8R7K574_TRIUA
MNDLFLPPNDYLYPPNLNFVQVLFILGGGQLIRPDIGNWLSHFFYFCNSSGQVITSRGLPDFIVSCFTIHVFTAYKITHISVLFIPWFYLLMYAKECSHTVISRWLEVCVWIFKTRCRLCIITSIRQDTLGLICGQ